MSVRPYTFDTWSTGGTGSKGVLSGLRECAPRLSVILVGGALSVSGTSSAEPTRVWEAPFVHEADATASGLGWANSTADSEAEVTRRAISELRKISGLTWEQLGMLFDVSRRSVHFWASGKPLNAGNEARLMRVLDVVREADRGNARGTRAAMFQVTEGETAFDMLVAQRFDDAREFLGRSVKRSSPTMAELSAEANAARMPLPPEELFDAKHGRVHREPGQARAARTVRNRRRGSS